MLNSKSPVGTTDEKSINVDVNPSSPTCTKPIVVGSVSLSANVPKHFAEAVKKLHEKHNVKLMTYQDYKNGWVSVVVIGNMDDLKSLNKECEDIAYSEFL
jgi:hypothetical protein